jgi:hypothetical protein
MLQQKSVRRAVKSVRQWMFAARASQGTTLVRGILVRGVMETARPERAGMIQTESPEARTTFTGPKRRRVKAIVLPG